MIADRNSGRDWIGYYLEQEIALSPQSIAGESVYFGAKHLMAYAQLCLVASELARSEKGSFISQSQSETSVVVF